MKDKIIKLREITGASILDCKSALDQTDDLDKAIEILRKQGQKLVDKKAGRQTSEGVVEAYIHANRKVGAMVELSCETDFVARNEQFIELAHDLAMQVVATNPSYLAPEDVPEKEIAKEKEIFKVQIKKEKKPDKVMKKILEGKLHKYYEEVCLTKQKFIKDDKKVIEELVNEAITKLGENIQIKKFIRFAL
ncbi:MAG: translation elongation factor Ts [Patescibacteria group bacterium]